MTTHRVNFGFAPYPHQAEAHRNRKRFSVLVWHRRAGKTVFAAMELLLAAASATRERSRFAYLAPFLKQAKAAAWDYLRHFAAKIPGATFNETELSVTFPTGHEVRIFGADNADALRGLYFDGVVVDEVADMKPNIWGEILRPALADRQGWALFIGTAKGVNLFSELYYRALQDEEWYAELRRASETGVVPAEELEQAKREMSANQYAQEFDCDFAAAAEDVLLRLEDVLAAQQREVESHEHRFAAKVLGVDVARYGGDRSCIFPRQGLVAFQPKVIRTGVDTMTLAGHVAEFIDRWKPDATFVEVTGIGAGVVDRLHQLRYRVIPVEPGGKALDPRFENKRAEMWWTMAEWVKGGGSLPSGQEIQQDLTAPKYTYKNSRGRLQLEKKDSMKARGLPSCDVGDALATTFFSPVSPTDPMAQDAKAKGGWDYNPHEERS